MPIPCYDYPASYDEEGKYEEQFNEPDPDRFWDGR